MLPACVRPGAGTQNATLVGPRGVCAWKNHGCVESQEPSRAAHSVGADPASFYAAPLHARVTILATLCRAVSIHVRSLGPGHEDTAGSTRELAKVGRTMPWRNQSDKSNQIELTYLH